MSRQKAINDKCRDCIYDPQAPGNWRQQTGACTIKSCSLWPFRPVSTPDRRSSRIQAETGPESTKESTIAPSSGTVQQGDGTWRTESHGTWSSGPCNLQNIPRSKP